MTGIERLRELAGGINPRSVWSVTSDEYDNAHGLDVEHKGGQLRDFLADIADQIERERDAEVADSPYDAILPEDREAIAWVRDHGGLDHVKAEWRSRSNLKRSLETAQAKVELQQRHIEFVQGKCRERQGRIVELERQRTEAVSAQLASDAALYDLRREVRDLCVAHGIEPGEDPLQAMGEALSELRSLRDWRDNAEPVYPMTVLLRRCKEYGVDTSDCEDGEDVLNNLIETLRLRLVPEGMEWPRYEDGKPVRIGDVVSDVEVRSVVFRDGGILLSDCTSVPGWGTWRSYKEPIKRPVPKVLDADGVEIREGDTVYQMGCKYRVSHLHGANDYVRIVYENSGRWVDPKTLTHERPVLAADGEPLEVGQTVWLIDTGAEYWVKSGQTITSDAVVIIRKTDCDCESEIVKASQLTHQRPVLGADGVPIREGDKVWIVENGHGPRIVKETHGPSCVHLLGISAAYRADQLTHAKPEPVDTWQRIEDDAGCTATKYNERRGTIFTTKQQVARDLVRRCRALAERDR